MVNDHNLIFSDSSLDNEVINASVKQALIKDICRRMTPQPLKIRADVELTCFSSDGIECIKDAMRAAEKVWIESGIWSFYGRGTYSCH